MSETSKSAGKKRKTWTQAERMEHSVVEKKRREEVNGMLLDLARKLPTLSDRKRVNKRTVILHANEHVQTQRQLVLETLPHIEALIAERDSLLQQVNAWTGQLGLPPQTPLVDASRHLNALRQVQSHTFSAFSGAALSAGNAEESPDSINGIQTTALSTVNLPSVQQQAAAAVTSQRRSSQLDPLLHSPGLQNMMHDPGIGNFQQIWPNTSSQPNYPPLQADAPYAAETPVSAFLRSLQDQSQDTWNV